MKTKAIFTLLLVATGFFQSFAQRGYSSASHAMMKQRSNSLMVPKPSEIVLDELFNYHTHQLKKPSRKYNVGLDLRWGNPYVNPQQQEAVLQVGFTTPRSGEFVDNTPVNICLVIDQSSSMSGKRIEHARQSALTLVSKLRPQDFVSLVVFNHQVGVLLDHEPATNKAKISQTIQGIYAGGSTDLNSGLIKGYDLVAKHYKEKANNKVLMLTDVLTNTGQVDVEAIIRNAKNYSKNHEIGITLVAIGVQVNDALGRQITKSGKHSFHYVNDSEDIKKIFVDEVESVFSKIAKDVKLEVSFDSNLKMQEFYGYSPRFKGNTISLDLNNMNAGLTQVVLTRFKALKPQINSEVKVKLSYFDVEKQKKVVQTQSLSLRADPNQSIDWLQNQEVRKCISIAEMGQCLKKMAIKLNKPRPTKQDYIAVQDMLDIQIGDIKKRYRKGRDKDVMRVLAMLEKYANAVRPLAK